MDRRVKFDTQEIKRQKVQSVPRKTREQTSRRELERKNIVERDNSQGKKKQVMGFEDFMKKKPSKAASKTPAEKAAQNRAVVYRGRVNSEINHKNEPPKSKVSNLKKRDVPVDYNDLPEVDQPEKKEMSLENIFNSRQVDEEQHHQEFRPVARNASEIIHEYRPDKLPSVANRSQLDNVTEPPHVGKSVDRGVNYQQAAEEAREYLTLAGDDNSPLSRNIRGTFKKEIYGNDPNNKKESQLRMKKELEKQMEENRLKKEEAKRLKEDEERIEHEKYQKYLEMEKRKKDEEELKEQEAKKKKEIFSMQQAALLEEYKQTVTAEKKIKHGKKTGLTDQGSVHFENIQAAGQASKPIQQSHIYQHNEKPTINLNSNTNNTGYAQYASQTNPTVVTIDPDINTGSNFATASRLNPNQSVSPPTMPIDPYHHFTQQDLQAYQRQLTPMTNFTSNEKNVLEGLLKENQGLKSEANRNNIILDFLTSVLVKKQNGNNSQMIQKSDIKEYLGPNPRLIEEPRTADVYPSSQAREQWARPSNHPSTNHSKKKPFRINTPVTQQFPKSTQGYGGGRLVKHDNHPAKTDQNKKYRGSNGHPQKQSYGNGHGKEAAISSMLEEFQDLDNFKMLPHEMDYGQQLQQAEIDHEYGSQYDYQGQGDGQEDQWRDIYALQRPIAFRQDSQLYHRDNYDEHDAYDSNVFPPARSEKYKQELAFKLSKIRNELNTKDSKIDSLISRIGTGS